MNKLLRAALYRARPFQGFLFVKLWFIVFYIDFKSYESRNQIAKEKLNEYSGRFASKFDLRFINTEDRPYPFTKLLGIPVYNYSFDADAVLADTQRYLIPCFLFTHWKETGVSNYDAYCSKLSSINQVSSTNSVIWRGAVTNISREKLLELDDNVLFDFKSINWGGPLNSQKRPKNFLTLEEQVQRARFIIDVEGAGYSARSKLLMHCPRVLLIQEQRFREYWFHDLEPWKHFVPVKKDFSDLKEVVQTLISDTELEKYILANQMKFAKQYLTSASADEVWKKMLKDDT